MMEVGGGGQEQYSETYASRLIGIRRAASATATRAARAKNFITEMSGKSSEGTDHEFMNLCFNSQEEI